MFTGSDRRPATTDIKGAQFRGRFDLDALRRPAITEIEPLVFEVELI